MTRPSVINIIYNCLLQCELLTHRYSISHSNEFATQNVMQVLGFTEVFYEEDTIVCTSIMKWYFSSNANELSQG